MSLSETERLARRMTDNGCQVVEVGSYAYIWRGSNPLAVGDQVLLPENWLSKMKYGPGAFGGTVTALGTNYAGDLTTILRKK